MNKLLFELRSMYGYQLCCNAGDMDPVGNAAALHAGSNVDSIAKKTVPRV